MQDNKYPSPLEAIIVILVVFATIIGVTVLFTVLMLLTDQADQNFTYAKYFYVLGAIPYIILPYLYARFRKYDIGSLFRIRSIPSYTVLLSLLIGISMSIVGDELDRLIQVVIPLPDFLKDQMQSMLAESTGDWILLIIGVVIFASLSEELVFRGFLQVTLEKQGDVTRAVLMSSLAWTLIHLNPFWAVQIFIMGVIIGFMAWRTGSILPGMIVHGTNNLLSLIFLNNEADLDWYTLGDHVSPIILLPSLLLLVYSIKKLTEYYRAINKQYSVE